MPPAIPRSWGVEYTPANQLQSSEFVFTIQGQILAATREEAMYYAALRIEAVFHFSVDTTRLLVWDTTVRA